uniref:RxLR effector protein n=1 Tax=Skeletonema marinoi TaxID=267567 RepID=A0A7S2KXB3_9STRA|mmetsp:Transcript_18099/g.30693  ORF Transcript_18099/g.30693 Transcript_18099/m.30693 type:complete len:114 (+) Transcript_18099:126-467(+)
MIMKTALLCSLTSMLVIASSAFVLNKHNARCNKMQLNLKRTVSKQISFSKKAVTPSHDTTSNEESYDENAFHRRIVHFEHHRKDEDEDDVKKHSNKKPYGGWNHRQFAKAIDP